MMMPPPPSPANANPNMGAFMQAQGSPLPQQSAPQMPPQGAKPSMPPQQGQEPQQPPMPAGQDPKIQALLAQIAKMGRGGDTLLAHLTPGEMMVPKEVQTPKLLKQLEKAYVTAGVKPSQFMAGTPQSSINPATGLHEYNFMSAFLPAALGIAGAVAAPMTGGASLGLSTAAMAALGGGLGTTAGGLLAGQTPTQALMSGALSGAGGYALSGLGGAAGAAGEAGKDAALTPAQQAVMAAKDPAAAYTAGGQMGLNMASPAVPASAMGPEAPGLSNLWGNASPGTINPMASIGSAAGGYIGSQLGAPPKPVGPVYPPGFNTPMHPVGSQGSAQQQLGMTSSNQPQPNFTGYNPSTNFPASYNFYPQPA